MKRSLPLQSCAQAGLTVLREGGNAVDAAIAAAAVLTVVGPTGNGLDLWKRFGRLSFTRLLESAISHAETGFEVTPAIAVLWTRGAAQLFTQPGFAETFIPNGKAPPPRISFEILIHNR